MCFPFFAAKPDSPVSGAGPAPNRAAAQLELHAVLTQLTCAKVTIVNPEANELSWPDCFWHGIRTPVCGVYHEALAFVVEGRICFLHLGRL
jgi:hypothetical protein